MKLLYTTAGIYKALGVVLATGAAPRKLGFKGEKEFQGRGVAYCATCDGEFFTGMDIFVIGGGFAAVEEGIFLTRYAKKVTLIVRGDHFTCAGTVSDQIKKEEKIQVRFNTEIIEAGGENVMSFARFRNNQTGEEWSYKAGENSGFGIFVFAGYVPCVSWLKGKVACNEAGYLITDTTQKTSVDGVYGAGDVCIKNLRQVVTAVADGAVAATSLEKHVSSLHEKLGIPPLERRAADMRRLSSEKGRDESSAGETVGILSPEIRGQLEELFPRFQEKVVIRAVLDDSPLAGEMGAFLGELEGLTDRLICIRETIGTEEQKLRKAAGELFPSFKLERVGKGGNIVFHGVPGGHEFNSFIIALYNMAGPGQPVEQNVRQQLSSIKSPVNVKVMVSLSCTMCPEVVMATQRAAALSDYVTAEMADLMYYPEIKKEFNIMSVPCMIVNDTEIYFGKKNLEEVTEILCRASE